MKSPFLPLLLALALTACETQPEEERLNTDPPGSPPTGSSISTTTAPMTFPGIRGGPTWDGLNSSGDGITGHLKPPWGKRHP
ncbi:MAG: hypothetical protein R2751_17450 [Bacteroidales bacterium]